MTTEEFIKEQTNRLVDKYKAGFEANGSHMSERDELFFRNGVANGISIASLALANIKGDDIIAVPSESSNSNDLAQARSINLV